MRRHEANPDLRQSCSQEASRKNKAVGEKAIEPAKKNIKKFNQGVCCDGTLLGIGDKHHALSPQLVQAFTCGKQTVNSHSKKWCEDHGTASSGGEIPDLRPRHHCSDICKAELAFPTVSEDIQRQALGLVKNVCRSMKTQVQSDRKQLLPSAKHPILLACCGDIVKAWIITQPVFKPLTFDGVRLDVPNMNLDDPPYVFRLRTQAAGEKEILDFVSMRRVMAEIVSFATEQPEVPVQYCLTRDYKSLVHTPLSNLHVNSPPAWVQLSSIVDESDDNDDDDDAGSDDGGSRVEPEISDLVSELLACRAQEEPAAKSASKSSRSTFVLKQNFWERATVHRNRNSLQ